MPKTNRHGPYVRAILFEQPNKKNEAYSLQGKPSDMGVCFLSIGSKYSQGKYAAAHIAALIKNYSFLNIVYSDVTLHWHNFKIQAWRNFENKRKLQGLNSEEILWQSQLEEEAKTQASLDLIKWGRVSFFYLYLYIYSLPRSYESFCELTQFYDAFLQRDNSLYTEIAHQWDNLISSHTETPRDREFFALLKGFIDVSTFPSPNNLSIIQDHFHKIITFFNANHHDCELNAWEAWVKEGQEREESPSIDELEEFYFNQPNFDKKLKTIAQAHVEKAYKNRPLSPQDKILHIENSIDYLSAELVKILLQPVLLGYSTVNYAGFLTEFLNLFSSNFKGENLLANLSVSSVKFCKSFTPQVGQIIGLNELRASPSLLHSPKEPLLISSRNTGSSKEYRNHRDFIPDRQAIDNSFKKIKQLQSFYASASPVNPSPEIIETAYMPSTI